MQETKAQTKNKGITLIALVVTIIVLLILAGVSIQMLAGQSGILKNAQQAREETVKGQIRDDVRREILEKMTENKGDISSADLYEILNKYFDLEHSGEGQNEEVKAPDQYGEGDNPWEEENFPESFPELHSREGNYSFNLGDIYSGTLGDTVTEDPKKHAGEIVAIPEDKKEKGWKADSVNPTLDEKGNIIPVPKDFHYVEGAESGKDEEKDNIGVVIADNNGNEFVWVPVPKATIETDQTTKIQGTTIEDITAEGVITPMAEREKGKTDYQGVLYDYSSMNNTTKTIKVMTYSKSSYREPDTVTSSGTQYDASSSNLQIIKTILGDQTNYGSASTFKSIMQEDYNAMVESVETYGGFYVARYEMSLTNWQDGEKTKKKAQFIKGATSATVETTSANTWYGFYAYEKQFATANKYTSVKSSMIWGSQYDAMMNWMARSGINIGGGTTNFTGKDRNTGSTTGTVATDVLNNVYDLLGNRWERTLEANLTDRRTGRSGSCSAEYSPSRRSDLYPTDTGYTVGSRASLYIL